MVESVGQLISEIIESGESNRELHVFLRAVSANLPPEEIKASPTLIKLAQLEMLDGGQFTETVNLSAEQIKNIAKIQEKDTQREEKLGSILGFGHQLPNGDYYWPWDDWIHGNERQNWDEKKNLW
jgi:hypothetical protein